MKKYYDAVIVGCGVAGCFTALHLPQEADILMITKADTEDSDSFLAQGGICVLKNESDYDAFYEDTMHAGHYENTPESVDIYDPFFPKCYQSAHCLGCGFPSR